MSNIFFPNSGFFISGEELTAVHKVVWGDVSIGEERMLAVVGTGLSGALPPEIKTDDVNVIALDGAVTSLGEQTVLLKENHRINVGPLEKITGFVDEPIIVTGENFYRITEVNFGSKKANFTVASPTRIEVNIPKDAEYTGVTVFSSLRSGEGGALYNSGISPDNFVPVPQVTSVEPGFQLPSEQLVISGYSFSAITGVQFPLSNEVVSPSNVTANSLTVTAPTGKSRGNFKYFLQSGISLAPSGEENSFSHLALIDRVVPDSGALGGAPIFLEGRNFVNQVLNITGDNRVKVKVGNRDTDDFRVLNSNLISGKLPKNLRSGIHLVSLYSDIGDIYPSGKEVIVSGSVPQVLGANPKFSITGSQISITGKDLKGIDKITLTRSDNTGISVNITGTGIISSSFGDRLELNVPSGLQEGEVSGRGSFHVDVLASGLFGQSETLDSGFFVVGNPFIEDVKGGVDITREPLSTGSLTGLNLLKQSKISFFDSVTEEEFGFFKATGVSGSGDLVTQNFFEFPQEFNSTGIKLRVSNIAGTSNFSEAISVYKKPTVSGFNPTSGEEGTTVSVSGYFSGLKDAQVLISDLTGLNITQNTTTGIQFDIPNGALTDFITIATSGGTGESNTKFSIVPNKPSITKFVPEPKSPLDYTVLGEKDRLDIIGKNLNIVNEIIFYDKDGNDITQRSFASKSSTKISVDLPSQKVITFTPEQGNVETRNLVSSDFSGVVRLKDRFNRTITGSQEFKIARVSGVSGQYATFDEQITITGEYFSGLNAAFIDENGNLVSGDFQQTNKFSESGFSIDVKIPREIVASTILITGNNNDSILSTTETFFPLATISGISGHDNFNLDVGSGISVTGINAFGDFASGDSVIGITGDDKHAFFDIKSQIRTSGDDGKSKTLIELNVGDNFTGSGQMFILNSWEDHRDSSYTFTGSKTEENINKILTNEFFNIVYPAPVISGISTGDKFNKRISGFISGNNLSPVTGVFFSGSGYIGDTLQPSGTLHAASGFVTESNRVIRFQPPFGSIETGSGFLVVQSPQGQADSTTSGGLVQLIPALELETPNFSVSEGTTGSTFNISGSGFSYLDKVFIQTVQHSGEADFTITSSTGAQITVPQFTISEGQDALVKLQGVLTDSLTAGERFTIIHDSPTVQFNVLSGRAAPQVSSNHSAIFTIVENLNGVDYYVTKVINPDGREVVVNTEQV